MPKLSKDFETLSACGNGPEDPYLVRKSRNQELTTGNFVLKPAREKAAFLAIKEFVANLSVKDPRWEELNSWINRLETYWKDNKE